MSPPKPTLKSIAAAAGVSGMTVSRALSGGKGVSVATRKRIQTLAKKLHYHRDSAAAILQSERSKHRPAFREFIALLITHTQSETEASWTFMGYRSGAEARAAELGYRILTVWMKNPEMKVKRVSEFLRSRNVRGALIIPENFHELAGGYGSIFRDLACGVMGGLPLNPAVHFVCNDHFATAANAAVRALSLGYRRPGFAILRAIDDRGDQRFGGGFHAVQTKIREADHIPTCRIDSFTPEAFVAWYLRHLPDVVLTHNRRIAVSDWLAPLGINVPRDVGWISLDVNPSERDVAGMDQRSSVIGGAALDLVHGHLQRGEYGEPEVQKGIFIEAVWQNGATVRPQGKPPAMVARV